MMMMLDEKKGRRWPKLTAVRRFSNSFSSFLHLRSTSKTERRFKLKDYTGILRLCFFASMTMMMMASFEYRTLAKAFKAFY